MGPHPRQQRPRGPGGTCLKVVRPKLSVVPVGKLRPRGKGARTQPEGGDGPWGLQPAHRPPPALQLVKQCNEGAHKMERMEQMYTLQTQLDFGKVKVGSPRGRLLCPAMPTARLARTRPSSQTTPPRGSPPGTEGAPGRRSEPGAWLRAADWMALRLRPGCISWAALGPVPTSSCRPGPPGTGA